MTSASPHRVPRMKLGTYCAALGLLLWVGGLTACGGSGSGSSSTSRPPATGCVADKSATEGETRYWVRDTVALGLKSSKVAFTVDASALLSTVNPLLPPGLTVQGPVSTALIGQTAIAFAHLAGSGSHKECVARAVDFINYHIGLSVSGILLAGQTAVKLVSASPDFYIVQQGMDIVGGSPEGPPTWMRTASGPTTNPPNAAGAGAIYVLDTAYLPDPTDKSCATPPGNTTPGALLCQPATALKSLCSDAKCLNILAQLGTGGTVDELYLPLPDENIVGPYGPAPSIREHGLFVSAVIHHVAANAHVHLIRVLNDHGVGDLQSLANGLAIVRQTSALDKVVVNMSLDLVPPPSCQTDVVAHYDTYSSGQGFAKCIGTGAAPSSPGLSTLGNSIGDLLAAKYMVVAAAGNDSSPGNTYGPDLPAAYCGVVAVAAAKQPVGDQWVYGNAKVQLDPQSNRSNGTCVADNYSGAVPADAAVAVGDNICSLFLESLPTGANPTGFVQWSGTSFATAYISGNLASGAISLGGSSHNLDESQPCTP